MELINTEYSPKKYREITPSRKEELEEMQSRLERVEKGLELKI